MKEICHRHFYWAIYIITLSCTSQRLSFKYELAATYAPGPYLAFSVPQS